MGSQILVNSNSTLLQTGEIMGKGAGTHLDPHLFALFTGNMQEVEEIQKQYVTAAYKIQNFLPGPAKQN
ncbi:MAG: hypothetical protein DRH26_18470 [Deltaproteobacteria bacterium]|nr:MAG: hypothetical protein DRH26_18470 [Deltaproteobacteria bacterium]